MVKDDKELTSAVCIENSFGDEGLSNEAIRDVKDKSIGGNGSVFPLCGK